MNSGLEYHLMVRHSLSASVARFGVVTLPLMLPFILMCSGHAQSNSASSVTASHASAPSASIAASNVSRSAPSRNPVKPHLPSPPRKDGPASGESDHSHHHYVPYIPPVIYTVPVPYAIDIGATDDNGDEDGDNYQGGPTIFDRRGNGEDSYVPPVDNRDNNDDRDSACADDPAEPEAPQVPTLLVFRDGQKVEVGNYAIVGATLFDLTPGHPRRVALADLDLDATRKENHDHGVSFQLPPPQAN